MEPPWQAELAADGRCATTIALAPLDLPLERSRPTSSKRRVFVDYFGARRRTSNSFEAGDAADPSE
jgi:hypothetical protein